jgi:hypothetical protein
MKLQTWRRVLLLNVCLAGCSFDFTDIPGDTPAGLSVDVGSSTQTDSLTLRAALNPGRDSDTNIRAVLSDLLVSGRALTSVPVGVNGGQEYQAEWSLSTDLPADATLVVRAPDIEGLQSPAQTFALSVPVRIGADTLFIGDDESVVLRLALATVPAEQASWTVEVTDSTFARRLILSTIGPPPNEIIIPRSWLSATRVQNVQLRVSQAFSGALIPGEYEWGAVVHTLIQWSIMLPVGTENESGSESVSVNGERGAGPRTAPR